jgi:hypothetical protein
MSPQRETLQYETGGNNNTAVIDEFDVHVTVHRDTFLIIKPTRCTNFSNLFLE